MTCLLLHSLLTVSPHSLALASGPLHLPCPLPGPSSSLPTSGLNVTSCSHSSHLCRLSLPSPSFAVSSEISSHPT